MRERRPGRRRGQERRRLAALARRLWRKNGTPKRHPPLLSRLRHLAPAGGHRLVPPRPAPDIPRIKQDSSAPPCRPPARPPAAAATSEASHPLPSRPCNRQH